jgi:hypothetical protein
MINVNQLLQSIIFSVPMALFTLPSFADNMPHQQLTVDMLQTPTPFKAEGKYYLVYEDILTNYERSPIQLSSLQVNQTVFENKALETMINTIASNTPSGGNGYKINFTPSEKNKPHKIIIKFGSDENKTDDLVLKSGESKLLFVWLPFDSINAIPNKISQTISYQLQSDDENSNEHYSVAATPIDIEKTSPFIVSPPLSGEKWLAANGASNTSKHRTSHIIINGHLYFAQRYAIDFIQVDKDGHSFSGPESDNKSYYCYGKDVLSVASGKVVEVLNNVPENIPNSGKLAINIDFNNVGGNHVIVQIDKKHYAFYAHLIPGSVQVKVGDTVKTGQVLGKLGNSGNSSEPHLHFHIVDGPSFLGANGIPYGFNTFNVLSNFAATPVKKADELVLENTMMNFGNSKNN